MCNLRRLAMSMILLVCFAFGCAEDVGDIDRTQPNRTKKSDLEGEWFVAQTVTDVPTTQYWTFVGDTSYMERIRWQIEEDVLIAMRSYARIDGSEPTADDDGFVESPVAAYPITGHFDVQRDYNASTGEQSNTISENSSDRPWYEREYIRVDWSTNLVTNLEFLSTTLGYSDFKYFPSEERDDSPDAAVFARNDDDELTYFDFTVSLVLEPDFWGCVYSWWGYSAEDCTSANIKLRTAFMRAERDREYEPVHYDDNLMTKFGYFRTERYAYDEWRGIRSTNRTYLANRFPIWQEVWDRDDDGTVKTDEDGRRLTIPIPDREPKPIVYYVSEESPDDIFADAQIVADGWDRAFKAAVAAAKNTSVDDVPRMFIVCHNPVEAGDEEACGEEGLVARTGDIRYNHMFWVDQFTQAGLLGFGPSGADPLTGEIVFGAAYVYGAEVETYAQYATDLVRLINGDLDDTDLQNAEYISNELRQRLVEDPSRPKARSAALKNMAVSRDISKLAPNKARKMALVKERGLERQPYDRNQHVMDKLKTSGLENLLIDKEIRIGRSRGQVDPNSDQEMNDITRDRIRPSNWASAHGMRQRKLAMMEAANKTMYLAEFADDAILGFAIENMDEEPATIRQKIRSAVYRAVMEHEVGHSIGLRHNFQGSYDALNYKDEYWELRGENLNAGNSIDDLYAMSEMTQTQKEGKMVEYQYSSIMDYGMRFNSDIQGLGKYDNAAILFGYTTGTYDQADGVEPGYVQVYNNPGGARSLLQRYADPPSLAFPTLLEEYHYTTVAQAFDSLADINDRDVMRYGDVVAQRDDADGPVEVHHMFCSDEWAGALVSCDVWDSGADPFEIAKNVMNNYRNYYPIHHYGRDRPFLWSEDVLFSMYGRYFSTLTNVYQNWVFAFFYGTDDIVMDNYYLFAATSGFNLLADVMATPQVGGYERNANGVWELVSYQPDDAFTLNVPYGVGRNLYTDYAYETGYYYFDRVQEVGHFWDFLAASFALTDSETTRLGVDDGADELTYSIPWFLFFEFELTDLFNAIFTQDWTYFSPRAVGGEVVMPKLSPLVADDGNGGDLYFDPETGETLPDALPGEPIDLDSSFTQQLYAGLYGMAFFTSNYSLSYPDQLKVFRLGAGEQVTAGAGFEVMTFSDPINGFEYGALNPIGEPPLTGAALLVAQGQQYATAYENATTDAEADDAYFSLLEVIDIINLGRGFYDVFGWSF